MQSLEEVSRICEESEWARAEEWFNGHYGDPDENDEAMEMYEEEWRGEDS